MTQEEWEDEMFVDPVSDEVRATFNKLVTMFIIGFGAGLMAGLWLL